MNMKCPYRTVTVHQPEYVQGYHKYYAKDIIEFGDCYGKECPYYDWVHGECKKIQMEEKSK